jgi:phosphoglycerate dehydrogenase-like enzyme
MVVLCNFTKNPARLKILEEQIHRALGDHMKQVELILDPPRWQEKLPEAEVIGAFALSPEEFTRCKKLRWLHLGVAGVEKSLHPALVSSKVVITNARGIHGDVMSEYVLAAILSCANRFDLAAAGKAAKAWRQKEIVHHRHTVVGKTVGIIGAGAIGAAAGKLCHACGMRVIGIRRSPERGAPRGFEKIYGINGLPQLLAESDYVVLAAPLTSQTQRLLGAKQFALMKPTAFFINIARGAMVDETALIEALGEKKIAGAVLDVFMDEPLPPESPLWNLEAVFITPHVSGNFEQYVERVGEQFAENLSRYVREEPLVNVVDKVRGY